MQFQCKDITLYNTHFTTSRLAQRFASVKRQYNQHIQLSEVKSTENNNAILKLVAGYKEITDQTNLLLCSQSTQVQKSGNK